DDRFRASRLSIDDKKIVVVDTSLNGEPAGILQRVLERQHGLALRETNCLLVNVFVAGAALQLVGEFNPIAAFADGASAGGDNLVSLKPLVGGFVRLSHHAHADADKAVAGPGVGVLVSQAGVMRQKLFDGAGNS